MSHPWPFTTLILAGGYFEKTPAEGWHAGVGPTRLHYHPPGSVLFRRASHVHSVLLPDGSVEAWTLVLRGVKEKSWGFWCPDKGYVPWREHAAALEATGRGCG